MPKNNPKKLTPLLTPEEVRNIFKISRVTEHRWNVAGTLKPVKIKGLKRYRESDIADLIESAK